MWWEGNDIRLILDDLLKGCCLHGKAFNRLF